jgi:hypothetical protein
MYTPQLLVALLSMFINTSAGFQTHSVFEDALHRSQSWLGYGNSGVVVHGDPSLATKMNCLAAAKTECNLL